MNKNIFFLIVIGVLLIGIVSAQPPFQQESGTSQGLTLRYPPIDVLKEGTDISAHIHVYNSSDGLLLTNSSVSCFVHIYDSTGNHILEKEMEFDNNNIDFELNISGGNFTIGKYSFIIWCNSSTEGGFVSGPFKVTPSGNDAPTYGEGMIFLGSLIAMLLAAGIFFFLSVSLKEHDGARFAFTSLTVITSVIVVLYSAVALSEIFFWSDRIISSYSTFLWVFLFSIFILFIFVLIMMIIKSLDLMRIKKGLKEQ